MSKALYFECATGISGDMAVAALLDLGADRAVLEKALASLPLHGFRTEISRVTKSGLDVCDFNVILDRDNHDHDMEYLHGHEHHHDHAHEHEHDHEHEQHHHHHEHATLPGILHIISHADATVGAKSLAGKIFIILAEAEAKAHGLPVDEVHFHEVGAVDSIVDIVAAAVCLDNLGIREYIFPAITEGTGTVRCQHGILPIPVPAVLNIAQAHGLRLAPGSIQGELVTPTGAAIAAAVKTADRLPESYRILASGMGAGKREYERPSILRVMLLETEEAQKDTIVKLETNIDDCTGEALGFVMDRLFAAGARDVHYTPVFMKKNRPGWLLTVICKEEKRKDLEAIIFRETTSIGIRRCAMERTVLERKPETVTTPFGEAQVKTCIVDGAKRSYPEYESVAALCRESGKPFQEVYRLIELLAN